MEKSELDKLLKDEDLRFKTAVSGHYRRYALSNSIANIGDIVRDHIGTIVVDNVSVSRCFNKYPECVYSGVLRKKNGDERKDGKRHDAWQSNVEEVIKL